MTVRYNGRFASSDAKKTSRQSQELIVNMYLYFKISVTYLQ
jgi:hypothetical protein